MDAAEYRRSLAHILATRSADVAATLERLGAAASEVAGVKVDGVTIDVFVDQDGEGPFDVWARFEGADVFELDRRFDDERRLFGVEWGSSAGNRRCRRDRGDGRAMTWRKRSSMSWRRGFDALVPSGPVDWGIGSGAGTLDRRLVGPSAGRDVTGPRG